MSSLKQVLYILLFFLNFSTICYAQTKVVTHFEYLISENEDKDTAERVATSQALQEAIEQIYVQISSDSNVTNLGVSRDVVYSASIGFLKIEKKDINFDNNKLIITLYTTVEDDIGKLIQNYSNDASNILQYEKLKSDYNEYKLKVNEKKSRLKSLTDKIDIEKVNEEIKDLDNQFLAAIWFEKGLIQHNSGLDDDSLLSLDTALKFSPNYENAYAAKGAVYYAQGKYNDALEELEKAMGIRRTYYEALCNIGLIYKKRGDYINSLIYLNRSLEANPFSGTTLNLRASIYSELNQYDKAINDYTEAIRLNYMDIDALVGLSMTMSKIGDYKSGLLWADRAINTNGKNYSGYMAKAMALAYSGKIKEAIEFCDISIVLCKEEDFRNKLSIIKKSLIENL